MSPFWEGVMRAWGSRLAFDAWIATNGFAMGAYAVRGQWWLVIAHATLLVMWLWLSGLKQRGVVS